MPENANSRNLYRFIFSPHSNSSTMRFSFTPAGEVVNIYFSCWHRCWPTHTSERRYQRCTYHQCFDPFAGSSSCFPTPVLIGSTSSCSILCSDLSLGSKTHLFSDRCPAFWGHASWYPGGIMRRVVRDETGDRGWEGGLDWTESTRTFLYLTHIPTSLTENRNTLKIKKRYDSQCMNLSESTKISKLHPHRGNWRWTSRRHRYRNVGRSGKNEVSSSSCLIRCRIVLVIIMSEWTGTWCMSLDVIHGC